VQASPVQSSSVQTSSVPSLPPDRCYAEITTSTGTLAALIDGADLTQPVPSCPDWTLRQLATHVGRVHRWVAEIVRTRSAEPVPFRDVPDGRFPDDPAQQPGWLVTGADRLIAELSQAAPGPVWARGEQRPATFWVRRMTHETVVHRADAQLATGAAPVIEPDIAADGIDEWLTVMSAPHPGEPDARLAGLKPGGSLHVHAGDMPSGQGEWLIRHGPDGIEVRREHGKGDAALRGPASGLLLVLTRRLTPEQAGAEVLGDPAALANWLAATPF
jgi:uncharacterized protein (TIGR03083 family)